MGHITVLMDEVGSVKRGLSIVFILVTVWLGANLVMLTGDYIDEMVSLKRFQPSIVSVKVKGGDRLSVSVRLNNVYSRDLTIQSITFSIFETENETLLMTGKRDYDGNLLILPVYSEKIYEFTGKPIVQIDHMQVCVRAEIKVTVKTLYYGNFIKQVAFNTTLIF